MSGRLSRLMIFAALGAAITLGLGVRLVGQSFRSWYGGDPPVHNVNYSGHFTFVRLRYTVGPGGYYYRGLPAWAHGYSHAEENLLQIVNAISVLHPRIDGSNVFALDDPELTRYPVAYMTEAGFWELSDREAKAFGAYLRKGGFIIFDDFRDPPRGGGGWNKFAENMARVLPNARIVDLDPSHPIFHSFFDIDSFDIIPQFYDEGRPVVRGIYEDNDPANRLIAIINYNTDISNFWEFSGTGLTPVDETNEAYELAVNYLIYGLTH